MRPQEKQCPRVRGRAWGQVWISSLPLPSWWPWISDLTPLWPHLERKIISKGTNPPEGCCDDGVIFFQHFRTCMGSNDILFIKQQQRPGVQLCSVRTKALPPSSQILICAFQGWREGVSLGLPCAPLSGLRIGITSCQASPGHQDSRHTFQVSSASHLQS